jgi:uncharacterized protein
MSERHTGSAAVSLAARVFVCALLGLAATGVSGRAQAPAAPQAPAGQAQGQPGQPGPGRQGGPGGNPPFAGQTPINALIISGGCCHDYSAQDKALMDLLNPLMPIHWTVVLGMTSLPGGKLPFYQNPDWAKGYDIVVHNECWTDDPSQQFLQQITAPHKVGTAAMIFHCSLHSYRSAQADDWRELIGVTSRRHTRAHNITVKWAAGDPITAGLPDFVTPIDELYVIEKVWPGTKALGTALNAVDDGFQGANETYPVVWTHEYGNGGRVFGTSLGHGNETWSTNQFKELVIRGFRWALKKEPIALPPPARGGGPGRGAAPGAADAAPGGGRR